MEQMMECLLARMDMKQATNRKADMEAIQEKVEAKMAKLLEDKMDA
jgi:hypothetical protein